MLTVWFKKTKVWTGGEITITLEGKCDGSDEGYRAELMRLHLVIESFLSRDTGELKTVEVAPIPDKVTKKKVTKKKVTKKMSEVAPIVEKMSEVAPIVEKMSEVAPIVEKTSEVAPIVEKMSEVAKAKALRGKMIGLALKDPEAQKLKQVIAIMPPDEAKAAEMQLKTKYIVPFIKNVLSLEVAEFNSLTVDKLETLLHILER